MTVDIETLMPEIEPTEMPPELPEAELNIEAPADKEPRARTDDGKFKGKEEGKEPEAKKPSEEKPKPEQRRDTIPLAAFLEDKNRWAAEKKALEERLAKLESPPKAPPPEPEFEKDPKGYTDHKLNTALEQLKAQQGDAQKQIEQVAQTAQMSREQAETLVFSQHLQTAEAAFVQQNPDYYEALAHVRNVRAQQLKLMAPDITDEQIGQQINQEEMNLAKQLARANRNPISTVYQLASAYGYQKKAAASGDELKLPDVPGQKQLPPDQTLGSGGTRGGDGPEETGDNKDEFDQAWSEMFGKRKAS
jgi:hypothetical protein